MPVEPIYSRDLRTAGLSTAVIEREARDGRMRRLRAGVYTDAGSWQHLAERERHLLRMTAVARTFRTRPVFSHLSAAAVWGIPVIGAWPDVVTIAVEGTSGMSRRRGVRGVRAVFAEGDVETRGGLRLTSLARTGLDIAQTCHLAQGVAALDHALAARALQREQLLTEIAARRPFIGVRRLERAISASFGLSESALESLSMARFVQFGWPLPEQQREFVTARGARYRVDFYWPGLDVVGEADGRMKYLTPEALWAEKRREDDVRETVASFARWGWDDAWHGLPLAERLRRAGLPPIPGNVSAHLHD